MRTSTFTCLAIMMALLLVFAFSCSRQNDPIQSGQMDMRAMEESIQPEDELISKFDPSLILNRGVMGAWKVVVDANSLSAEIVPARNASAIGDIYDADLSQFLLVSPCHNCMRISNLAFDGYGDVLMTLAMKHPFDDFASRPDLHGFDVRAIFILPHSAVHDYSDIQVMNPDGTTENAWLDNTGRNCFAEAPNGLLNADGYTSHFDWLPDDERYFISGNNPDGNLNPFLRFFEDDSTGAFDPHSPSGYNVMPVGAGYYERTGVLSKSLFQKSGFEFYIVADVAYGHSAVLANRPDPQYYLPSFNRTEAWRAEYWIENNNLNIVNPSSTADLVVQVFDWQHGHAVDPEYPDSANLSGLRETSNVLQLELSIPGFQNDPIIVTTPESGAGTPEDPLQYRLTVTNQNSASGSCMGILAIRDELYGAAQPSGRHAIPNVPAGFPYDTIDVLDYTLYMPVVINMKNPMLFFFSGGHFKGELVYDFEDLYTNSDSTIIAPDFFMDTSHKKFQYYWDYDYDGVTFDVDDTGLPSPKIPLSPGYHNVALGVRTNSEPPKEYIYELPVYARGEAFNRVLSIDDLKNITSATRGHSAAKSSNGNYYFVFTADFGGNRNLHLATVNRDASFLTTVQLTVSSNATTNPSICVVDSGSAQGVYVAYTEQHGSDQFIFVNHGNLDGTGWDMANVRRISTAASAFEYWPLITYFDNALRVYYMNTAFIASRIHSSHSNDLGDTWIDDGWVLDNSSSLQYYPSITQSFNTLFITWSDGIEYTDEGWDLYFAQKPPSSPFTDIANISPEKGKVDYLYPSMDSVGSNNIVIAYLAIPDGASTGNTLRIRVMDPVNSIINDFPIMEADSSEWIGMPSVGTASHDRFIIAYPLKNTISNTMKFTAREYYREFGLNWYRSDLIFENMGIIDSAISNVHPVVVSTSPQPYVVENLIAWTDYSSGSTYVTSPNQHLGNISASYYITDKNETGWF